jgi:pimeloyl-ACP methyl ester carboxylesterase
MNSDQLKDFRLITFDLPGHGNSGKAFDPENQYCFNGLVGIIKSIVEELGLKELVLVGHSLGGHIAIQALAQIPNVVGLMVCGTPPLGIPPRFDLAFKPIPETSLIFKPEISEAEATRLSSVYGASLTIKNAVIQDVIKTDVVFRAYLGQSIANGGFVNEIDAIDHFKGLKCIVLGEKDQFINVQYIEDLNVSNLWHNKIHVIKEAEHLLHYENFVEFNNLLYDFVIDTI